VDEFKTKTGIRPVAQDFSELKDRGISAATAAKYGVWTDGERHQYPWYRDGIHAGNQYRIINTKDFFTEGKVGADCQLFGQQLFEPGSARAVTITEGACDAMAAFEMSGSRFPCVAVKSADGAARQCANNFEWLNSFDRIVVALDKDDAKVNPTTGEVRYPGQEAALAVAALFPLGKVHVLTLKEYKDPNDYLLHGKAQGYIQEWWQAPVYTPSGLKLGRDLWDEVSKPREVETISYPWAGLNEKTYGARLTELVILTAETGDGKTTILKEIGHHFLEELKREKKDYGVGFMMLEEPNYDTALGLMSITANRPLHLPDVRSSVSTEELRKYFTDTLDSDRVVVWDHFGSNSVHEVLAKIRHMVAMGCKYVFLDHLSIVVSDQSGDERKQLDEIATKIKTLCMELSIFVLAVIHLNREGKIRGSAGVEQLGNLVLKCVRDKEDADETRRNTTKLMVQKNRFTGRTGPACHLFYDSMTGRLVELSKEQAMNYEQKTSQEIWA
jgi:twinkle protein